MVFLAPYTTTYEEYCVQHHVPFGFGAYGGPVPSYYAPPYGPQFGAAYDYGAGMMPGMMPGMMGGVMPGMMPGMMMGGMMGGMMPGMMGNGYRDAFGVVRGDWAGPFNGGTEGNIEN